MELQAALNLVFGYYSDHAVPPESSLPVAVALADWAHSDKEALEREVGLLTAQEVMQWRDEALPDEDFEAPMFKRLVRQWD